QGEIVISSRIRLARNLAGYNFVNHAGRTQRAEILSRCREQVLSADLADQVLWIDLAESPETDRQLLVERQLISRQHALEGPDRPRAVAIDPDETFAIMINEEDHVRISVLRSGLQLDTAFDQIDAIDDALESRLDWAYSSRWGYMTACPTNVGTGIRMSVMMHLPALKLTGEIDKVRRAARDLHLAVRGLFGEGSEAYGDLYQLSNQTTLGRGEQEILQDFKQHIVPQVIAYEQQAREALVQHRGRQLDDKIWRAWAVLTHARVISAEEVLTCLSHLRMGVNLGRIDTVDIRTINELFLLTQPAHLHVLTGCEMEQNARREARADLIRQRLGAS
ncbi:MAG: protein arginine kinase, partial [Phycisphaeraceae bacterium]|nr:protein arginine kinase [Phycisphaeraceae bacterium]